MRLFSVLLVFAFYFPSYAQNEQLIRFLAVDRLHSAKRYRFYPNQLIHLKQINGERIYGPITKILDSGIVVANDTVALNDIRLVYLEDKALAAHLLSDVLITTAIGYFAISTFNRTINDDAPIVHRSSYHYGVPALGIGLMIKLLVRPKVKIRKEFQLKVIDL